MYLFIHAGSGDDRVRLEWEIDVIFEAVITSIAILLNDKFPQVFKVWEKILARIHCGLGRQYGVNIGTGDGLSGRRHTIT